MSGKNVNFVKNDINENKICNSDNVMYKYTQTTQKIRNSKKAYYLNLFR